MARHWYARYIGDYAAKTAHLSQGQHGAYVLLMDHYYATGACVPANAPAQWRICRAQTDEEKENVRLVLSEFFTLQEDGYHNERADKEIIKSNGISDVRRAAREEREKRRRAKAGANEPANAPALEDTTTTTTTIEKKESTHAPSGALPAGMELPSPPVSLKDGAISPQTGTGQGRAVARVPSAPEIDMGFQRVWNAYPGRGKNGETGAAYKGAKVNALKCFTTIYKQEKESEREKLVDRIVQGCGSYAGHLDRTGHCSAHCSTWLNARRYLDDYGSAPGAAPAGQRPAGYSIESVLAGALADKTRNPGPSKP